MRKNTPSPTHGASCCVPCPWTRVSVPGTVVWMAGPAFIGENRMTHPRTPSGSIVPTMTGT
jgi:hypothetical protein